MFMMMSEKIGDKKVFLCYFPPGMTNFIQPIDAGLGRSVRISVGNFLDEWLMIEEIWNAGNQNGLQLKGVL